MDGIGRALGLVEMTTEELAEVAESTRLCICTPNNPAGIDINNAFFGKNHTEETRKLLSEIAKTRTGSKNPMFGKRQSAYTRSLISAKVIGKQTRLGTVMSEESKKKISDTKKSANRSWFNDGSRSVLSSTRPDGFVAGRLPWGRN